MKCEITIQHVAAVPGYEKIYLQFSKPENGLERLLVSALKFKTPKYVAGKEPKCSLYVGAPVEKIIEGAPARQWTPSYKKFSWQRFWAEMKEQNPSYSFECKCGTWLRSDKLYNRHKKHCLVMKEFKVFLARIENFQTYKDAENVERKDKRKKNTGNKRQRKPNTTKATKKVARRRTGKH